MTNNTLTFRPDVAEKLGAHRINDPIMASLVIEQLRLWELNGHGYKDEQGNLWQLPTTEDWEQTSGRTFSPWRVRDVLSKLEQLGYLIREKFCHLSDILINSPCLRGDNHSKMLRLNWERLTSLWGVEDEEVINESVEPDSSDGYRSDQISDPDLIRSDQNQISEVEPTKEQIPDETLELIAEVRNVTGKLTPQLKKLVLETQPTILKTALSRYPREADVKKPCSYLMRIIEQISIEQISKAESVAPPAKIINESDMHQWFLQACAKGLLDHDPLDFKYLPVKSNQLCCRVKIEQRTPNHPPYELRPLVELMRASGR